MTDQETFFKFFSKMGVPYAGYPKGKAGTFADEPKSSRYWISVSQTYFVLIRGENF